MYARTYVCMFVCMYVVMVVCMYVYGCIFIYRSIYIYQEVATISSPDKFALFASCFGTCAREMFVSDGLRTRGAITTNGFLHIVLAPCSSRTRTGHPNCACTTRSSELRPGSHSIASDGLMVCVCVYV